MRMLPRLLAVASLVVAVVVPSAVCQNVSVPWYALDGGFAIASSSSTSLASVLGQDVVQPMQAGEHDGPLRIPRGSLCSRRDLVGAGRSD